MVTEGLFNIAILKIRPGESDVVGTHRADGGESNQAPGINHYGFVVPNMEDMLAKLPSDGKTSKRPSIRPFAEWRTFDPDGNGIDISAQLGYEVGVDRWVRASG